MADLPEFRALYQEHCDMVYNVCLNYLRNESDAEEVTQDVFVKIAKRMNAFKGKSTLKTWIYRITVNSCLDLLKARKRKKRSAVFVRLFSKNREMPDIEIPDMNHPGIQLEDKEALASIFAAIDGLPDLQRNVILLKYTEGLSVKELAKVLKTTPKSIESALSRARANLKKKLIRE